VLAPTLAGTSSKVYDGNTSASLASASVGTSGAIDGDSATFALAGGATFDTRHAGSGKVVSAPVTFVGVSNGAIPVYGYSLASGTASGAIGSITPAALSLAAGADSKVYDGGSASAVTPGVVSGSSPATR
jgi:fructose-specific phosphotransferase system IIC component